MVQIVDHQLQRAATGGGATLGQAPVPLLPIIADLRAAMLRVHGSKDLEIELRIEPAAGFLGDRGDLTELLGNLLDNACKWGRGKVLVSAFIDTDSTPPQLVIRVDDDGAGIASADRERVLTRGVRADERSPGHGLGLAMVSDTVALYGGGLTLGTSATLGGAHLEVRLPGRAVTRLD
jgi:two-component system sensor histidine kinase PhoQ